MSRTETALAQALASTMSVKAVRRAAAAALGRLGGLKTSAAKAAAVRKNGACPRKDGKPRGHKKGIKFPNRKRPTRKGTK